jgi:leucyl-tRNA synthetase
MVRFIRRFWRVVNDAAAQPDSPAGVDTPLARKAHETIARVTDDIERRFVFNTPIAAVMELVNELSKAPDDPAARFAAETAVSVLQPYAPHVCEELWGVLGRSRLWDSPWPVADEALLVRDEVELVLQVNGKVRDRVRVPAGLSNDELIERARASERVQAHVNGGTERRVIVVPDKLVNIVV